MPALELQNKKAGQKACLKTPTEEEVHQSCIEAIEAFKRGEMDKFTSHEQMKRLFL